MAIFPPYSWRMSFFLISFHTNVENEIFYLLPNLNWSKKTNKPQGQFFKTESQKSIF